MSDANWQLWLDLFYNAASLRCRARRILQAQSRRELVSWRDQAERLARAPFFDELELARYGHTPDAPDVFRLLLRSITRVTPFSMWAPCAPDKGDAARSTAARIALDASAFAADAGDYSRPLCCLSPCADALLDVLRKHSLSAGHVCNIGSYRLEHGENARRAPETALLALAVDVDCATSALVGVRCLVVVHVDHHALAYAWSDAEISDAQGTGVVSFCLHLNCALPFEAIDQVDVTLSLVAPNANASIKWQETPRVRIFARSCHTDLDLGAHEWLLDGVDCTLVVRDGSVSSTERDWRDAMRDHSRCLRSEMRVVSRCIERIGGSCQALAVRAIYKSWTATLEHFAPSGAAVAPEEFMLTVGGAHYDLSDAAITAIEDACPPGIIAHPVRA